MALATYVTLAPVTYVEDGEVRSVTKAGVRIKLDEIQAAALAGAISYIEGGIQNEDLPRTVTLRYWTVADFPTIGDVNYLYLADGTGYLYRWQALAGEYVAILGAGGGGGSGGGSGINVVNLLDHGAVGDGVADDSDAFKAAQALMRDGTVLHIPAGTYRIASAPTAPLDRAALTLSGLNNIGVYFEPGAVMLMDNLIEGHSTTSGILVRGKSEHVTIINPTVRWKTRPIERGGQSNGVVAFGYPSDSAPAEGWLGSTGTVSHLTIVNPTVEQSAEAGIYIVGCSDVNVTGSRSIDTLADGLHFNACRRVTVNNHHAVNVEDDGLAFVNYYHPTQKWEDSYIGPFWLPGLSEWCSSGTATNVVVNGNRANGFRVQMCQDLAISNVEVTDKDQFFKFTSATLDGSNPWQSLASRNVVASNLVGADCAGGGCIETYNIDGADDKKWWDFAGCEIRNVTARNMGNWSFSCEGKDSDNSAVSGITIDGYTAIAGDSTPGEEQGGHGGIRLVGLINSEIRNVKLVSDHETADIYISSAGQRPGYVNGVEVTPTSIESYVPRNLIFDGLITEGAGRILFQDIAGVSVGRLDSRNCAGVGVVLQRVKDVNIEHIGVRNPGRTSPLTRGVQIDQVCNVDIAEIFVNTDSVVGSSLWQVLELGGGDSTYPAGKGVRIEKLVYTSTRNATASDVAVQSGSFGPVDWYVDARWRHSGEASPKWRGRRYGAPVSSLNPATWIDGPVDFNTLITGGVYWVAGAFLNGAPDTTYHQPGTNTGLVKLTVTVANPNDTVSPLSVLQEFTSLEHPETRGQRRLFDGTWSNWSTNAGYIQLAKNPDVIITGAITLDANDLVTSAEVIWPDFTSGTLTITSRDSNGAVLAYNITYGGSITYTQPAITRNANGAATYVPPIVVS